MTRKDFLVLFVCVCVPILAVIFLTIYSIKVSPTPAAPPAAPPAVADAAEAAKTAAFSKKLADDADEYCRELGTGPGKPMLYIDCMKKREDMPMGVVIFPDGHGGTYARQY
jgi:hypothetical protein